MTPSLKGVLVLVALGTTLQIGCGNMDLEEQGPNEPQGYESTQANLEPPAMGVSCFEGACSSEAFEVETFFRDAASEALHLQANGRTTAPDVLDLMDSWGYRELKKRHEEGTEREKFIIRLVDDGGREFGQTLSTVKERSSRDSLIAQRMAELRQVREPLVALVRQMGGQVTAEFWIDNSIEVEMPLAALEQVVDLPSVEGVFPEAEVTNNQSQWYDGERITDE